MSENDHKANRLPLSMYCQRSAIVGFGDEKDLAERVLETSLAGRICICILPILEDKKHYYLQCNFKRSPDDIGDFKIVNTLDLIVNQGVLRLPIFNKGGAGGLRWAGRPPRDFWQIRTYQPADWLVEN
jgi:hypothetical protein